MIDCNRVRELAQKSTLPAEASRKSSAREDTTKFLDEIEPALQKIKKLFWGDEATKITADQLALEAHRLEPIAVQAREWIEGHGQLIRRRMRVRRDGTLSRENQLLIDRLNVADLTIRSFLTVAGISGNRSRQES